MADVGPKKTKAKDRLLIIRTKPECVQKTRGKKECVPEQGFPTVPPSGRQKNTGRIHFTGSLVLASADRLPKPGARDEKVREAVEVVRQARKKQTQQG